jgi:GAF domain-containing protein
VRLFEEVEARTRELSQSVEELRALGEVSQAVNSTLDLQNALDTIVARAAQISGTEAGAIYVFDEGQNEFQLSATFGMSADMIAAEDAAGQIRHGGRSRACAGRRSSPGSFSRTVFSAAITSLRRFRRWWSPFHRRSPHVALPLRSREDAKSYSKRGHRAMAVNRIL